MTYKTLILFGFLAVTLTLGACTGQQNNVFGEQKPAPDEFAVYSRAPLSLPPDFGLRPPKPGATRPQTVMPRNEAREALLSSGGQTVRQGAPASQQDANLSPGLRALLASTGADRTDPEIRSLVNSETAALSGGSEEGFAEKILFWRQKTGLKGAVLDPAVEERRMRQQKAEGDAVEENTPPPTIQRRGGGSSREEDKSEGFFGSLFNF